MPTRTRSTTLALVIAVASAQAAGAQQLATYGGAQLAGLGEGSAILGVSLGFGREGLYPVVGLMGQSYTFRVGSGTSTNTAIAPSVGLAYKEGEQLFQGNVGYSFVNSGSAGPGFPFGIPTGGVSGPFVSGQWSYWGNRMEDGAIASYNFRSQYIWSRLRLAREITTAPSTPVYLGGEVVAQGTSKNSPSAYRFQVGPTINFHISPAFHVGGSAGARFGNNNQPTTGYVGVDFLLLTDLGK